ncbi:diaminopimelate epimerase [Raoultibacter phocaeensis]|uniref:diaminopimelate epimerase n=1 Tax=Raoultibacter phocaeensis TaxID=2479841 RepID=UPI0011188DD5|nr:diaminopimelate epimerase [Raoultibacter phocaeensis]
MELDFAKLHGAGNDFIVIDDFSREIELTAQQIAWLCDRRFGIGADGIILVRPSDTPECAAYMHYINADGSLAEMCGNGVRCFAKYLVDRRFVETKDRFLAADTKAGVRSITYSVDEAGALVSATVDMGTPALAPETVPTTLRANAESPWGEPCVLDAVVESPWGPFAFTCVSMGNPHAVCFLDDMNSLPDGLFADFTDKTLATFDLDRIGAYFEHHPAFPEKTNVEFAVASEKGIAMRVYERGCSETLACGTGACATGVAACLSGRAPRTNEVLLPGGVLAIDWKDDGRVFMTGPSEESFSGTVRIPDL